MVLRKINLDEGENLQLGDQYFDEINIKARE